MRVVFNTYKVKQYYNLKSQTPLHLKAKCVYQFNCSGDLNKSYIGKTIRHLAIRCKEHLVGNLAIFEHKRSCMHCKNASLDNFKILNIGNTDLDIKIIEALQIKAKRPTLNNQLTHNGASFLLQIFT